MCSTPPPFFPCKIDWKCKGGKEEGAQLLGIEKWEGNLRPSVNNISAQNLGIAIYGNNQQQENHLFPLTLDLNNVKNI